MQAVAKTIAQSLNRPGDFAAHWGGEEFVVLLPNTDIDGAIHIAERIRLNISNIVIPCADGAETKVTISIGANTQAPRQDSSREGFISKADKALYAAKEAGRNRVCAYDEWLITKVAVYKCTQITKSPCIFCDYAIYYCHGEPGVASHVSHRFRSII